MRMFAFVDETGNTGANLLDESQPDFYTAALITKSDFDLVYAQDIRRLAKQFGDGPLHGKDLGFGRAEAIAKALLQVFKKADARFFISRVEKRYLLATKIFDTFFDSGENAAVAWHIYNVRPLKIILALKVASIVSEDVALSFWNMLLEMNEAKAKGALPSICQSIIERVDELPDQRSRDIVRDALIWAQEHPETIHIHLDSRQARNGHMPNMVAFANLLDGLEGFSKRWARPVRRITHDRQSQFDKTLTSWHEMYSNASPEPIKLVGETVVFQKVAGSIFEVKSDVDSAGIQAIDVILWLYLQHTREARFPRQCNRLLNCAFRKAYMGDFSFSGVESMIEKKFGHILWAPISPEQEAGARKMIELGEARRLESMAQYKRDGIVPFMRSFQEPVPQLGPPPAKPDDA
jgi:hypothetical protein